MLFVIELTYANEQIIPMVFSVLAAILIYVMWRWKWCYTFINFSNNWLNLDKYRCKHVHPLFFSLKIFHILIDNSRYRKRNDHWSLICYNHWSITKEMIVFYFKILDMCFQKKKNDVKGISKYSMENKHSLSYRLILSNSMSKFNDRLTTCAGDCQQKWIIIYDKTRGCGTDWRHIVDETSALWFQTTDSVDCMKYHRWLYAEGTLRQVFLRCW